MYLLESQMRDIRDEAQYRMLRLTRQSQPVRLLPSADTRLGCIKLGCLLRQTLLPQLGILRLLERQAGAVI